MDIAQLKTLIHVAELGSLSKASDRLHIAQPALSRQIQKLEQELGIYLFDRHGRGMDITDIGQEVVAHASRILEEMDSIRRAATENRSSFRGTVVLGATPTVAEIVTVPLITQLRESHPHLGIRVSSAFSGHLLDWLQRGELDLAVTYDPQPVHTLKIQPVMMESLMLVGPGEAGLKLDQPVSFASLRDQSLVVPSHRHGLRTIVDKCARDVGIHLRCDIEADSFGAMTNLVRNGFGWAILPLAPIHNLVQDGTFSAAPLVDPQPMRKLVLVFPADRRISPAARYAGQTFTEITADMVARGIWAGHML